jgi:hypothetical protein
MAHSLILGMTESGKTTLAKELANHYKSQGIGVIVLDPMNDPGWLCDYKTADPAEFLKVFWASKQCAAFIDESGDSVGRFDTAMIQTATKGRHWGHNCHYITQRGAQLAVTVRDQCSHLFLFTTSLNDSKVHANEWNKPELQTACSLDKGHYFHATRFGVLTREKLF